MAKGLRIQSDTPGSGREAGRGDVVVANLRLFLNRGDEVTAEYPDSPRTVIDLGKRHTIAGVRYGIEGMREGGSRMFVISPHLAYGEEGMGEWIPPNAVLRCEVELLEVHDPGYTDTASRDSSPLISVFIPGIATEARPRIQVNLSLSPAAGALITRARPDGSWRRAQEVGIAWQIAPSEFSMLLDEAVSLPERLPGDCLDDEALWADASEPANSVTRDDETDTPCISIGVVLPATEPNWYSVRQDSRAWRQSAIRSCLVRWLSDHLREGEIP